MILDIQGVKGLLNTFQNVVHVPREEGLEAAGDSILLRHISAKLRASNFGPEKTPMHLFIYTSA